MVKRFTVGEIENQDTIFDYDGIGDYYHLGNDTRDVIALCKLLNELHEENLKLKKDNSRLVNETANIIAEHQKQVLDLVDEKIKELKNINNVSIIPRESIDILEQLKKELWD